MKAALKDVQEGEREGRPEGGIWMRGGGGGSGSLGERWCAGEGGMWG